MLPVPLGIVIGLVASMAAGGTAGAFINGWRVSSVYAHKMAEQQKEMNVLELKVKDQNATIDGMRISTEAAERAQAQAEKWAEEIATQSRKRVKTADAIKATTCPEMIEALKDIRR